MGPEHLPELVACLQSVLSNDAAIRKAAEGTLDQLSAIPGYCSCLAVRVREGIGDGDGPRLVVRLSGTGLLQEIIANKGADHRARWLASVNLKNTVIKMWRPRSSAP